MFSGLLIGSLLAVAPPADAAWVVPYAPAPARLVEGLRSYGDTQLGRAFFARNRELGAIRGFQVDSESQLRVLGAMTARLKNPEDFTERFQRAVESKDHQALQGLEEELRGAYRQAVPDVQKLVADHVAAVAEEVYEGRIDKGQLKAIAQEMEPFSMYGADVRLHLRPLQSWEGLKQIADQLAAGQALQDPLSGSTRFEEKDLGSRHRPIDGDGTDPEHISRMVAFIDRWHSPDPIFLRKSPLFSDPKIQEALARARERGVGIHVKAPLKQLPPSAKGAPARIESAGRMPLSPDQTPTIRDFFDQPVQIFAEGQHIDYRQKQAPSGRGRVDDTKVADAATTVTMWREGDRMGVSFSGVKELYSVEEGGWNDVLRFEPEENHLVLLSEGGLRGTRKIKLHYVLAPVHGGGYALRGTFHFYQDNTAAASAAGRNQESFVLATEYSMKFGDQEP